MSERKRPTSYSEELGIEICARIAEGATLKEIAKDESMPAVRSMMRWVHEHPEFDRRYNVAQKEKADTILDEVREIIDEPVADNAQASRQRNRAEYRIRMAEMLNPAKFSKRLGIGQAPELPQLNAQEDPIEVARRVAFVLARGDALLAEREARAPRLLPAPPRPPEPTSAPAVAAEVVDEDQERARIMAEARAQAEARSEWWASALNPLHGMTPEQQQEAGYVEGDWSMHGDGPGGSLEEHGLAEPQKGPIRSALSARRR